MKLVRTLGLAAWLSLGLLASLAQAQTDDASRATARDLATAGVEAFQRGSFADASAKLEKAYRVLRVPSFGLWSARALVKVGKLVQASERYREVAGLDGSAGDKTVQRQAQVDAAKELEELTPRIPVVVIRIEGASPDDVNISVDGTKMESVLVGEKRPLDPGKHRVEGTRGSQTSHVDVVVAEGEMKDVVLKFAPASAVPAGAPASTAPQTAAAVDAKSAPTPPAVHDGGLGTQKTLALVAGGVGVVGVGIGSVFGLRAKTKLAAANAGGCASTCPDVPSHDANEAALAAGNISTIAFVVGGAAMAGGLVLWLTAKPSDQTAPQVGLNLNGVQARMAW